MGWCWRGDPPPRRRRQAGTRAALSAVMRAAVRRGAQAAGPDGSSLLTLQRFNPMMRQCT